MQIKHGGIKKDAGLLYNPTPTTELSHTGELTMLNPDTKGQRESTPGVGSRAWLACVETDLAPIKAQLSALSEKYRDGGEERIGWEVLNAVRALDETIYLSRVYLSGKPLPTIAEMRGIFKQANKKVSDER